jgi:hypothetical protein
LVRVRADPAVRLLWCAGLAAVIVAFGAPALVHAQADTDPGQTAQREEIVGEEAAATAEAWEDEPYTVVDGKVDFGT